MSKGSKSWFKQTASFQIQHFVMLAVMLGTGTVSINNSSFNPAIPQLMHDFHVGESAVSWVMVIFLLSMSLSLLLTGFLSQRFGKRRVYLTALCIFMLSSIGGAFSSQFASVLVIRAIQGFASGLMIPLSLGIIFSVTPQHQRGAATGMWGAMIMLTLACGPMFGALVLVWANWQALFLLNVPFTLCALVFGWFYLPKDELLKKRSFDWNGFLLLSIAIVTLLIALSQIRHLTDLQHPQFIGLLAFSMIAFLGFLYISPKKKNAIINFQLFSSAGFNCSLMISIAHTIGLFITLLLIPLLVQNTLHLSPVWTGSMLMLSAFTTSLCSKQAGKYLDQAQASRLLTIGLVLTCIAFIGLGLMADQSIYLLMFCMIIHGLGFGLSYMPATTAGLNSLNNQDLVTQGAAINNLFRRLLSAIAVVAAALYLQIRTQNFTHANALHIEQIQAIRELFFACAFLLFLVIPFAVKFPEYKRQDIQVLKN